MTDSASLFIHSGLASPKVCVPQWRISELFLDLVGCGDLVVVVLEGTIAAPSWMIRNNHRRAADIVGVVRLDRVVAHSGRRILHERAVPSLVRRIRRIHLHLDR